MERINCEILDLRAFLMVVELGSFHRTAEALNLSQPALSRRIQKLEAAIGSPLLERTTRHVAPTAIGEDLLPLVRRMLEEFDGSLFASRDPKRRGGIVSMACLPTAAFYFLPEVIRAFSVDHPETRFRILDLPATDGLQAVARGEVEFGVNIMGASDPDLVFDRLVEDPFVLAARKGHPLAERERVTWTDLAPYPLITVHRSSANRVLLELDAGEGEPEPALDLRGHAPLDVAGARRGRPRHLGSAAHGDTAGRPPHPRHPPDPRSGGLPDHRRGPKARRVDLTRRRHLHELAHRNMGRRGQVGLTASAGKQSATLY